LRGKSKLQHGAPAFKNFRVATAAIVAAFLQGWPKQKSDISAKPTQVQPLQHCVSKRAKVIHHGHRLPAFPAVYGCIVIRKHWFLLVFKPVEERIPAPNFELSKAGNFYLNVNADSIS
jgi:hypothetical protein